MKTFLAGFVQFSLDTYLIMKISSQNIRPQLRMYLQSFRPDYAALKQTARDFLPYAAGAAVAAASVNYSYDAFPCVKEIVDAARDTLKQHQAFYEYSASGLALGLIPDLMAQRYEILSKTREKIDLRRIAVMSAVGAVSGGLIIRQMFDFNVDTFQGSGLSQTVKRVLFDQFVFTPPYLGSFFAAMHIMNKGKLKDLPYATLKKLSEVLPVNWLVFGGCFSWIIYMSPPDAMIYVQTALAVMWRSFLYHKASVGLDMK